MSFIVNAIVGVVKAVVSVVTSVVKAVFNVVADVINFVAAPFMALLGIKMPNAAQEAARQEGVLIQKNGGGSVPIPVVYGYRKVGGIVTFCETGSTDNKYLWVAYTFSEGPVEGIHSLFIDDNQLSADTVTQLQAGLPVVVQDAKYKNRVILQWYDGRYFNNPADSPVGNNSQLIYAPSWKSTNAYNGLATLFVRYEWIEPETQEEADANPFSGNIPNVQIGLLGKKVSSLRAGANTHLVEYQASGYTERYSTNPAEILLDYLRNPRYGKGLKNSDIDWNSFYIAAAKCNQEISYNGSARGPILTLNYVVDTDQSLFNNVKNMLVNFRAYMPYVQGKYKLKIEDAGHPTDILSGAADIAAIFNRDTIVGDINYTGIDRSAKATQVKVTYVDPDQKFSNQEVVYPATEAERQVYINYDGGRENTVEITLSGITNQQIARDMARLAFFKSRYQETCSLRVSATGFNLEPGDNVFIQSNILNFGTTPWRIISIKLNNDYTFDLGCVRNPDFIYPYVTPNTPDRVIAPYIPKGASVLQPLTGGGSLVGLTPPVTAPRPGTVVVPPGTPGGNLGNSPATPVTGPDGGGVGGDGGTVNTGGGAPVENPQVVNILKDVVSIDNVTYSYAGTDMGYAELTFKQPNHPMYDSLQIYYKFGTAENDGAPWTKVDVTTRPGAGQNITYKLGPLALPYPTNTNYIVRTRIKYSTGEYSTVVGKIYLKFDGTAGSVDPGDFSEVVGIGWDLPTGTSTYRANAPSYVSGITVVDGAGQPLTPRAMDLVFQQETSLFFNPEIKGIKVYYKQVASNFWRERQFDFVGYVPGLKTQAVRLDDLGIPGNSTKYDFIFRFVYSDNTESTQQRRFMNIEIESSLGIYKFEAFYGYNGILEAASSYSFLTEEQGIASGALIDPRDMKIGIAAVEVASSSPESMRVFNIEPDATVANSWVGLRVYYRPVLPGQNTPLTQLDFKGLNKGSYGAFLTRNFVLNTTFYQEYQILVVPLVFHNGQVVEGNYSNLGQGYAHFNQTASDYPSNANWVSKFKWKIAETSLLKGEASTTFSQTSPTIIYSAYSVFDSNPGVSAGYTTQTGGGVTTATIKEYYNVVCSVAHIGSDFKALHVYRRCKGAITVPETYYGLGRWDHLTFNTSSPAYSAGTFNLKLRFPSAVEEFSMYNTLPNIYPNSRGLTNQPAQIPVNSVGSLKDELWFVIETFSAGFSTQAIKLPGSPGSAGSSNDDLRAKQGVQLPVAWPPADASSYNPGYMRNLNEARTAPVNQTSLPDSNIYVPGATGGFYCATQYYQSGIY